MGRSMLDFSLDIKVQEALYFFHSPSTLEAPAWKSTMFVPSLKAGSHVQPTQESPLEWPGIIRCLDPMGMRESEREFSVGYHPQGTAPTPG